MCVCVGACECPPKTLTREEERWEGMAWGKEGQKRAEKTRRNGREKGEEK